MFAARGTPPPTRAPSVTSFPYASPSSPGAELVHRRRTEHARACKASKRNRAAQTADTQNSGVPSCAHQLRTPSVGPACARKRTRTAFACTTPLTRTIRRACAHNLTRAAP
eukprot:1820230-Pleurochrysis_carterae.AAC.7